MTLLSVESLGVAYGLRKVVHDVSFCVGERCVTAILGANGAGKTTIVKAVSGLIKSDGAVRFAGKSISNAPSHSIAGLGIAHVPEGRGTFPGLTVEENLKVGAITRRNPNFVRDAIEWAYKCFPILAERRFQFAGTLSGGEQQMLAIARALALRPRLLILDEPSFGVAPIVVTRIFELLSRLRREEGIAMLLIEQNASLALAFADEAYLVETGRIVLSGAARKLQDDESVKKHYLGC